MTLIDPISRRILHELTQDGRLSYRELGERVGFAGKIAGLIEKPGR